MDQIARLNWAGRRVLVTGAGGFIGSHLCEALVEEGAEVTAFVRYTSRGAMGLLDLLSPQVRRAIRTVAGDLRDPQAVRAAVKGHAHVFHLGALVAIPYSYRHPDEVVDVNVGGTLNILNAAREHAVERLVHTSTSEVYGTAITVPMSESHPLQAQSPYSASKIAADALAFSFHCSYGLPVATLRPFNTYGPRQSGRAVIPTIVGQALKGGELRLGSLDPTRDLTFVADTVRGFLAIAASEHTVGQTVAIGTGTEISIGELARTIVRRTGREVRLVQEAERLRPGMSEVQRLVCDPSRAKALMGWEAQVSLEDGLDQVIAFMRSRPAWTSVSTYEV